MRYYFEPCLQSAVYTKLLMGAEKEKLLKQMNDWSGNATVLETGEIVFKR